eukprot:3939801-Rhodomonas_salina.1
MKKVKAFPWLSHSEVSAAPPWAGADLNPYSPISPTLYRQAGQQDRCYTDGERRGPSRLP